MLFEMGDKFNKPIKVDARDKSDCTPLHLASNRGHEQIAEWLLRRGADINLANAKGSTPLHLISAGKMDCADLLKTFFEISDEQRRPVEVDARDNEGKTPLHHAISHRHKKLFELLLRRGFDPNIADNDGSTALHAICMVDDDNGWAKMLFEISEEKNRQVQIDVRGVCDFTPLHHALVKEELRAVAELLLRKGAATNLVDWEGSTPLHTVCKYADDEDRVKMLIEISNEENKPVEVDARDKLGRTPLHLALARGNGQVVKYLLKLGADPNLADENGFSPLHVVSKDRYDDDELLKLFFDASKKVDRPVQVDVQDKNGRTPLQWAVANLFLNAVDVLLDRGADLSNFVFPSKSFFVERFGSISEMDEREWLGFKLSLASKIVVLVERLEKRGYEFDRHNTLDIMGLFAEYGLFENSVDLKEYWYNDEEFVSRSKEIMVNPSLSLHDLIRLRPEEAEKQLKYENYVEVARSNKLSELSEDHREVILIIL
ncbi:ankyrin-1-like [Trichogramma pretiosum]|uniref:ankyrin-1-like n=1 Tax=Trichogramma pretiosum TaxID=7493 RepID=UPI000C71B32C|nr:ankyrin-1-like [Trichogramma pretiosum]